MSTAVILAWMLLQFPGSTGFHTQVDHRCMPTGERIVVDLPDPGVAAAAKRAAAYQEKQFEDSFNHLVKTLVEFADQYNSGRKIDVKKVKAMKKAWRELEKSDPWFGEEKTR
jgi:hypothetical protein